MLGSEQVYKLVGPLLYPIDTDEAKDNVGKRLEFIEREVGTAEKKIAEQNDSMNQLAKEIQILQGEMRAEAAKAAAEAAAAGSA
jgi:prefoldin beta subunit